jgi:hypothetical protein
MATLQTVDGRPQTWDELMRRNAEFYSTRAPDGHARVIVLVQAP